MWLNYGGGRTASEFPLGIQGHGTIPQYLLHPQNQVADLIAKVAPALKAYLDKKKNDEIANEVMNMQNPPRAEAVDQYGATYDPSLAARQGWTGTTEPPNRAPATGGADAFKAQQLYADLLRKQQADQAESMNEYWKNKAQEALVNKRNADANSPDLPRNGPEYVDTPYGRMTAQQWAEYQRKQIKAEGGLPKGVPLSVYQNSKTQNFNPAQAFRDAQELPSPDLPPVTEADTTPAVSSQAEYDSLPSGAVYIAPDGKKHRKP